MASHRIVIAELIFSSTLPTWHPHESLLVSCVNGIDKPMDSTVHLHRHSNRLVTNANVINNRLIHIYISFHISTTTITNAIITNTSNVNVTDNETP